MNRNRILIVDDNIPVAHLIRDFLKGEGYDTSIATDGKQALQTIEKISPAIVILDIMLPELNGFEVLKQLRTWSDVPVIALSAYGETETKIKCLKSGADDYLTKPFSTEELSARIDAILPRIENRKKEVFVKPFRCNDILIDYEKRKVWLGEKEIQLTPLEFELLKELTLNANKILSCEYLLHHVWGPEFYSEKEYLHVHIGHIRLKIGDNPKNPKLIETIPRIGYRFNSGGSQSETDDFHSTGGQKHAEPEGKDMIYKKGYEKIPEDSNIGKSQFNLIHQILPCESW